MQCVESVPPQRAVVLEPFVHFHEGFRPQAVDAPLRVLSYVDQPGLAQHPQVAGDPRTGDRQRLGQLACRRRMVAKYLEHRAPAGVPQCLQYRIHAVNVTDSGT